MKKVFIGIGSYTGNGFCTGSDDIKGLVSNFLDLAELKGIDVIGAYKGELGVYLEESLMLDYKDTAIEDLKVSYPMEEAFYVADVKGFTKVGNIKETLSKQLVNLDLDKGFTLKRLEKEWYLVLTNNGQLIKG